MSPSRWGGKIKNIVVLGSTGSIGKQAIDVALAHPDSFNIVGLAANTDVAEMERQIALAAPSHVCLVDKQAAADLKERAGRSITVLGGREGLDELCGLGPADTVLNAIVGSAGLSATLKAIEAKKHLALANKESMVAAGDLVNRALQEHGGEIFPVDSEHSALWQCLSGERIAAVSRLILTASGGPFWECRDRSPETVTPAEALAHPRWRMGQRISIDSATLMNKGFEVIEAHYLFGVPYDRIEVLIHPQSIVHSLVEFVDGSVKAQLGPTDMRLPILYSLTAPDRLAAHWPPFDLAEIATLEFHRPEPAWSGCLKTAYTAGRLGRSYPAVLNAADEVAVEAFLTGLIGFHQIGNIIDTVLANHDGVLIQSLTDFEAVDQWARSEAANAVSKVQGRV
jgi:1-deoxy-D-xylulose-5-phosphate reductoisomerase